MASLFQRGDSWQLQFLYKGERRTWGLGSVDSLDARAIQAKAELLLARIKQHLLDVPAGCDIVDFLRFDGRPPAEAPRQSAPTLTLGRLRDVYLEQRKAKLLPRSHQSDRLHWKPLARLLGEKTEAEHLTFADLQIFIRSRVAEGVEPATAKKEIVTLRTSWNWGVKNGLLVEAFPGKGLEYPPSHERPPFMTFAEIEKRVAAGESETLWESVFLTRPEIDALLQVVRERAVFPFVHPLACFAAHTGARRGELARVLLTDVDLSAGTVLIRETKRRRGFKESTRRVPLSPTLKAALGEWMAQHPGGPYLFTHTAVVARSKKRSRTTGHRGERTRLSTIGGRMATVRPREDTPPTGLTTHEIHGAFKRTLAGTKWAVVGLHALRHSFISNCAAVGVDQRMIDAWVGHTTEEMRRRYRHLIPSAEQSAIAAVFGPAATLPADTATVHRD
jgi:integrase